jgi:hypothetical protein
MRILTRVDTAAAKVWQVSQVGDADGEPDRVGDAAGDAAYEFFNALAPYRPRHSPGWIAK